MSNKARTALATTITALFLAAVSAAGVVVHSARPNAASAQGSHGVAITQSGRPSQPKAAPTLIQREHD